MKRVLVVDDNRELAENIGEILEAEGYTVDVAFEPETAQQLARTHSHDVAILDVRLPGMDGVSLFKKLSERHPAATYVLMTAFTTDDRVAEALEAGVRAVLPKPVAVQTLMELLPPPAQTSGRILLVEDDDALAAALSEALGEWGYRTAVAPSLAEAEATLAAEEPPAGAVVDVRLPDGDGTTLARALCAKGVPTVLITGYEPTEAMAAVAVQCARNCQILTKPFAPDALLETLRRLAGTPAHAP
jgi:two-component system, NtrC family, response regulator HydG